LYPRSSIYKSPVRLANSVGIIDSGYRGHICGVFDLRCTPPIKVNAMERYVQLCAGTLEPFTVTVVDTIEELGMNTRRGDGGFGSTGN
jgi:dUTP pyrophosphatase